MGIGVGLVEHQLIDIIFKWPPGISQCPAGPVRALWECHGYYHSAYNNCLWYIFTIVCVVLNEE